MSSLHRTGLRRGLRSSVLASWILICAAPALFAQAPDWSGVESALGRKGAPNPGDVLRFSFPRTDLTVTVQGVTLKPAFALGTWVAFEPTDSAHVMVMGDLVLAEGEVGRVMARLQQGGVDATALHNHLIGELPRVMYMHIMGLGNAVALARTIRAALEVTGTPLGASAPPPQAPLDLDTVAIAAALGRSGRSNAGVYQISAPRAELVLVGAEELPVAMGLATAINFQSTGGGKAAITGDFVLSDAEVNDVARILRAHGIEVTAIHNHMIGEEPRLYFMHFWANANAVELAKGVRAALDVMDLR